MEDSSDDSGDEFEGKKTLQESAVDITEKFIKDRLDPALVTGRFRQGPIISRNLNFPPK